MDSSPAQRLMSRRLKTSLPVTSKLLEPYVATGVVERLRYRKQLAKSCYDKSAHDLPELNIGERIRMKPLPGENPALWRVGTCLQKVAPRSYLVNVGGSLYRRNRVHLRVAESSSSQAVDRNEPELPSMLEGDVADAPSSADSTLVKPLPQASYDLVKPSSSEGHTHTRSGRLSMPPKRLDL